jgi:hypothetical protein
MENSISLSPKKLKWLFFDIKDQGANIKVCVKGKWRTHFESLVHITESSLILDDISARTLRYIPMLDVDAFQLDRKVFGFEKHAINKLNFDKHASSSGFRVSSFDTNKL